jgi:hypothetical protein
VEDGGRYAVTRTADDRVKVTEPGKNYNLMQFFAYEHLPEQLRAVSAPFAELAAKLNHSLPDNPEKTVALRKLLEGKDCAVRAQLFKSAPQESTAGSVPEAPKAAALPTRVRSLLERLANNPAHGHPVEALIIEAREVLDEANRTSAGGR